MRAAKKKPEDSPYNGNQLQDQVIRHRKNSVEEYQGKTTDERDFALRDEDVEDPDEIEEENVVLHTPGGEMPDPSEKHGPERSDLEDEE